MNLAQENGPIFFLGWESELTGIFTIGGKPPALINLSLEQSVDLITWVDRDLGEYETLPGNVTNQRICIVLTRNTYYRFFASRIGGDDTTTLLATGYARRHPGEKGTLGP
jgi:hypothetical protein